MKTIYTVGLVFAALIISTSMDVLAQPQSASTPASAADASATSAPATGRKADRALRRAVYAAIVKQKDINAGDISVIAKNGAVTLNGTVTDASQIDRVVQIAKGVPGVTSVTNKLGVKKPFGQM
jgi:hyperosmotically inducible periplasmic protein